MAPIRLWCRRGIEVLHKCVRGQRSAESTHFRCRVCVQVSTENMGYRRERRKQTIEPLRGNDRRDEKADHSRRNAGQELGGFDCSKSLCCASFTLGIRRLRFAWNMRSIGCLLETTLSFERGKAMNRHVLHGMICLVAVFLSFREGVLLAAHAASDDPVNCGTGCMEVISCSTQDPVTFDCTTWWFLNKSCAQCCYGGPASGMCNQIANASICVPIECLKVTTWIDDDSDGCEFCYNCDYTKQFCQDNITNTGDQTDDYPIGSCPDGPPK
jgi:hypothetical protein